MTDTTETTTTTDAAEAAITYTVDREALGIWHVAARDECRPVLASVVAQNGKLMAADGFMAAQVDAPGFTNDEPILFLAADLGAVWKMARTGGEATLRREGAEAPSDTVQWMASGRSKHRMIVDEVDGTFPDMDKTFQRDASPIAWVTLNVDLLGQLLKFMGRVSPNGVVQFRVWGPHKAVELRARDDNGRNARALIMPMVLAGGESADDWLAEGLPDYAAADRFEDEEDDAEVQS